MKGFGIGKATAARSSATKAKIVASIVFEERTGEEIEARISLMYLSSNARVEKDESMVTERSLNVV